MCFNFQNIIGACSIVLNYLKDSDIFMHFKKEYAYYGYVFPYSICWGENIYQNMLW